MTDNSNTPTIKDTALGGVFDTTFQGGATSPGDPGGTFDNSFVGPQGPAGPTGADGLFYTTVVVNDLGSGVYTLTYSGAGLTDFTTNQFTVPGGSGGTTLTADQILAALNTLDGSIDLNDVLISDAIARQADVTSAIATEAMLRFDEDTLILARLDAIDALDSVSQAELTAAVAAEAGLRVTGDTNLQGEITTEIADRTNADDALGTRIDDLDDELGVEEDTREMDDLALGVRIDGKQDTLVFDSTPRRCLN